MSKLEADSFANEVAHRYAGEFEICHGHIVSVAREGFERGSSIARDEIKALTAENARLEAERKEYECVAEQWMRGYDKLKAKYEQLIALTPAPEQGEVEDA